MTIRSFIALALLSISILCPSIALSDAGASAPLSIGDKVKVVVFGHEDLSGEYQINNAGEISLPLIKSIKAEGNSLQDLESAIFAKLSPDYLKNPKISVLLIGQRPFFILGEIKNPGSYPFLSQLTVLKAVATAGGYTYRARKNSIIITRARTGEKEKVKNAANTHIYPGDVIEIPERFF